MAKVAFLGLGTMGFPMASHLKRVGHEVTVFNRTSFKAERWVNENGGCLTASPSEAARDQDYVLACVGDDDDLRSVTVGENGAFKTMAAGAIFIDHTTTSAKVARELYRAARGYDLHFIDAPVSGGEVGAINGELTVMCGGDEEHFQAVKDIVAAYAISVKYLGAAGNGQLCKMVNQICLAGIIQSLSEGLAFGKKAGLDMHKAIEVITKGAAGSWQMANRSKQMLNGKFDYGFAVDLMRKDLAICLDEARSNQSSLPIAALVDQFYCDVQGNNGGRLDTSSLIKRML